MSLLKSKQLIGQWERNEQLTKSVIKAHMPSISRSSDSAAFDRGAREYVILQQIFTRIFYLARSFAQGHGPMNDIIHDEIKLTAIKSRKLVEVRRRERRSRYRRRGGYK